MTTSDVASDLASEITTNGLVLGNLLTERVLDVSAMLSKASREFVDGKMELS